MEIGPALPPHLAQKLNSSREENSTKNEEKQRSSEARKQTEEKSDSDEEESYGPALPPGFKKNKESASSSRFIGPMRPQFDASCSSTITSNGLYRML